MNFGLYATSLRLACTSIVVEHGGELEQSVLTCQPSLDFVLINKLEDVWCIRQKDGTADDRYDEEDVQL